MNTSFLHPSRPQRRSQAGRAQRLHSFSRSWRRQASAALLIGLLPLGQPHTAHAQATNTWNGSGGDWNTAVNWSQGIVPNGSGGIFFAVVNPAGGSDNLTHSSSTGPGGVDTIFSFLNSGLFNLTGGILAGSQANAASTFVNNGTVNLSGGATLRNFTVTGSPITINGSGTLDNVTTGLVGTVFGTLTFANNTVATVGGGSSLGLGSYNDGVTETLTGTGTLVLGNAGGTGTLNVGQYDAGVIGTGTVVSGAGMGGVINGGNGNSSLANSGTIQANGGTLTVQGLGGGFTNNATLRAINGGTLNLNTSVTNTSTILAASSTVNLNSITVTGGTLSSTGTGVVNVNQSALTNVTTGAGTAISVIGGRSNAFGTLTNSGTITVGSGDTLGLGSYNDGPITLAGGGSVLLTGGTLAVGQYDAAAIGAGQTVSATSGASVLNFDNGNSSLTSKGVIQSTGTGATLTIQGGNSGFTSSGTLQALNGSTLNLNVSLTNTGLFTAGAGSTINLNGITLTGTDGTTTGLLSTTGMGVVNANQSALTNVTSSASISVTGGRSNAFGTLTNSGTITVGSGDTLGLGSYNDGTHTLAGGGSVLLTGGTLAVGQYDAAAIGAGQTVSATSGASVLNFDNGNSSLTNNGTIKASGGTLTVQGGNAGFTNASGGLVESVNGGTFNLNVNLVGSLFVDGASAFNLNGVNVSSGTLSGTGTFTLFNSSLSNDTISSSLSLTAQDTSTPPNPVGNGTFYGTNTLTGGSVITVGGGNTLGLGSYNDGVTETLTGAGSVVLGDARGSGTLNVGQYDAAAIGPNVVVTTGSGRTGVINGGNGNSTLANNGVITATGTGGTLTIQGLTAGFTNAKTLQAVGGGTINLNTNLTNTGLLTAGAGSTLNLNGITLTGTDGTTTGLLSTTGTGVVNSNQSALVNVTTGAGTAISVIGGRSNAFGTLTNSGTITVGSGDTLGLGSYNDGTHTLAGVGAVVLSGTGALDVAQYDAGVIAAGATVRGAGTINGDNGNSTLTNSGVIQANGGTLTVQNLGSVTSSEGNFAAVNAGTLNVNSGLTGGSTGTVTTAPTGTVNLNNSLTQDRGTSQIDGVVNMGGGNTLTVTGGTLKGIGTITGNVTQTGGTVAPGDSPGTLSVTGAFNGSGGGVLSIEYTASQTAPTAHDLLAVSGAVTLGGQRLDVSFVGPPNANGTYLATTGESGTSFDFLSFGTLTNGGLGGLFTNETGNAATGFFVNGIAANNVGSSPAVYQLTQNGNALHLTLTTAATPEPSQWAAFGLGILGLAGLGLHARRKPAHSA